MKQKQWKGRQMYVYFSFKVPFKILSLQRSKVFGLSKFLAGG